MVVWPPSLSTVTSTVPALCGGAVAVIMRELTIVGSTAACAPKSTPIWDSNGPPMMVTRVPPATGPWLGVIVSTRGAKVEEPPFESDELAPVGLSGHPAQSIAKSGVVTTSNTRFAQACMHVPLLSAACPSARRLVPAIPNDLPKADSIQM